MGVIRDMVQRRINPNVLYQNMYQSNPQFRQFADAMQGKSPEQAFQEAGYDFNQFRGMMN